MAAAVVAGALAAGHGVAEFAAARWWTAAVAPSGLGFVTRWILLRGVLEGLGLFLGAAWFAGNLLVVARAIGSVELPRRIGDLDIREAVPSTAVFALAIVVGAILGLLAGAGGGRQTGAVLLAWHGLHFGLTDPVLGHDAAMYVAQLPLWVAALHFIDTLIYGALATVLVAYASLGALKVGRGGIAITDDARAHLGLLLAGVVATFAVGTLLLPIRDLARSGGGAGLPALLEVAAAGTLALAAAAGAFLIGGWALRGRMTLLVAGVISTVLVISVRAGLFGLGGPTASEPDVRSFTAAAWGLAGIDDRPITATAEAPGPPTSTGWWTAGVLLPVGPPGQRVVAASRGEVPVAGVHRRVWLALRASGDSTLLSVIADDEANAAGGPLSFRAGDPLAYPGLVTYRSLPAGSIWPGAPDRTLGGTGLPVGGAARRLTLAWAAQSGALLASGVTDSTRLGWHLDPIVRLAQLFPPAAWSDPQLILDGGRVTWAVPGSLLFAAFPLAPRGEVLGFPAGGADAGLLGVVDAATGAVRIFLLPNAGPVARAWREIARGLIEPADSIPPAIVAGISYPASWLATQAGILGQGAFGLPPAASDSGELVRPVPVWDSTRTAQQVAFVDLEPPGRVVALLSGEVRRGRLTLRLLRIPDGATLPGPRRLVRSWTAFPSYAQLADSIRLAGSQMVAGPVTYEWRQGRLEAAQVNYRTTPSALPAIVWVGVAMDRRSGAGRDIPAAWADLMGRAHPPVPDPGAALRLSQARLWVERADSALARGDLVAFGRAFSALKALVEAP